MAVMTRRTMMVAAGAAGLLGCQRPADDGAKVQVSSGDAELQRQRVAADAARADAFYAASFKDFDAKPQSLGQYKGKPVVAYFWATWCKPCVEEVPMLQALEQKWRDRGVVFVGIAVDNADKVRAFVREKAITYPVLVGGNDALELSKTLGNLIKAVPFMALFGRDGRFAGRFVGEVKRDELERAVAAIAG